MKKILNEWRRFLTEGYINYSGILQIKPDAEVLGELETLQAMLPEEAIRLELKDLHLTLIHQSILSPFKDHLKKIDFPVPPPIVLDDEVFERSSPGKKSWAVRVVNQDEMRDYVKEIMASLGSENLNPEPERRFHVSLANLTGEPKDSVR
jgi:2'-5' RNA ligase